MAAFIVKSESTDPGVLLDVSPTVREHARAHGGRLYVWLENVNGAWAVEKASTAPPPGSLEFDEYEVEGFTLHLQRGREHPEGIRLMLSPWAPFEPLAIPDGGEVAILRRVSAAAARFTV